MQRTPRTLLTALAAASLLGTAFTGSAAAAGGRHEAPGQVRTAGAAAVTEDNDANDGGTANDVVDARDNRHPSGKDRSVEGGAGTQGRSTSDPDDDGRGPDRSNGGPDKPGGAGGVDLADQDGNNGCGNDDDFEDDNEGWCGQKPKPAGAEAASAGAPTPEGDVLASGAAADACAAAGMFGARTKHAGCTLAAAGFRAPLSARSSGEVLAAELVSAAPASVEVTAASPTPASVLGSAVSGAAGTLAFTGLSALTILLAGLVALAIGALLVRASRRQH